MTRSQLTILILVAAGLAATGAWAQDDATPATGPGNGNGVCQFVDEDGDGFNDLAPDHDGDGIPNGLDPDWVKPEDGTGYMNRIASQYGELLARWFGADAAAGLGEANGHAYGPGDGSGTAPGPNDGTGFGPGESTGMGGAEGAGPQVDNQRQGRR